MRLPILALALAGALSACGLTQENSAALRTAAINYINSMQAAGVDVIDLDPQTQGLVLANCGLATAVLTVYDPTVQGTPTEVGAWCAGVAQAIADEGA